jgi:catechol 2,3-dioxygenase-like lactoylglutathione lyase family enzyme
MQVERLSFVLPVADMQRSVAFWTEVLGVEATFVDGDRWAQFDVGGGRLSLAGRDRVSELPGAMINVSDLYAVRRVIVARGITADEIDEGEHERRCVATDTEGWPVILYEPRAT